MTPLRIIRSDEVAPQNVRGQGREAGQIKRIIANDKFFFNVDQISPGYSPHRWHRHDRYRAEGMEVEYAPDFEEIYFVMNGSGLIQWKDETGAIHEQGVGPGDTIHMPPGVVPHQLLNNGNETLRIAVVGVPPPRRTSV